MDENKKTPSGALIKLQKGVYHITRFGVKCFFPQYKAEGVENLPDEPCIIIGNHAQMNGPIISQLYMPRRTFCWCTGEMMHLKEVPAYAMKDFWSDKPKSIKLFYKGLSYLIAPLSVCVFNHADTIGVYKDHRGIRAFRDSVQRLKEGYDIIIFPEKHEPYNHILNDFQLGFVDVAKLFNKAVDQPISFVPAYIAPAFHKIYFGSPIYFDPKAPIKQERVRIISELKESITQMAEALPRHRVVPYTNIPKKDYPYNK